MPDLLARAAQAHGARLAVKGDDAALSYAELDARASGLAAALAAAGARPGLHVAVALPPSAEHVALTHAVARVGAVLVPLDPRLPSRELAERVRFAAAGLAIVAPGHVEAARAAGAKPLTPAELADGAAGPRSARARARARPDAPAVLVFTSGTTGRPRAPVLSQGAVLASARQAAEHLGLSPEDRWLACVPLHHVGGLGVVLRCALRGAAVVLHERFEAARVAGAIDAGEATLASMVPAMLQRVLAERGPKPWPRSLRAILLGGDAAPRDLLDACRAQGAPVLPTYGLTEAASMVACAEPGAPAPLGSAGRPVGATRVRIVDQKGQPLPAGEVGEIEVRGPTLMTRYHGEPGATKAALRGGWLRTGDVGWLDKEGLLWIAGRADERIVTGGEKVDAARVEDVLRGHPAVADACVVGLADVAWGQVVAAAVALRPGCAAGPRELEAHCRLRLAGFEVPRRWLFVAEVPRGATGKPARGEVRALLGEEEPAA